MVEVGADPSEVVPLVLPLLDEKTDYNLCWQAGQILARIDPDEARRQVSRMIREIEATESSLDGNAPCVQALFGLRSVANEAVPLLIRLLSDTDRYVRSMAMSILGGIGPDAVPAVAMLKDLVDRDSWAIETLGRIGPLRDLPFPGWLNSSTPIRMTPS